MLRTLLAALALAAAAPALAQSYPSKPIRLLIPYGPGGVGDITARFVAQKMGENMKNPIVVENRPGAGLIAGSDPCAKAPPDGYTMCLTGVGSALNATLFKSLPFDIMQDFTHLSTIAFLDINPASGLATPKLEKHLPGWLDRVCPPARNVL